MNVADRHGSTWIDYWDSQAEFNPMMRIATDHFHQRAGELIGFGPGDVVLDIGCGPGDLVAQLAGTVREIHGVDTSVSMIRRCRQRFDGRTDVHFHVLDPHDYTSLSFLPAARFNRIICLSVVQYYRRHLELHDLIGSVRRIAAPGARFLIADIPVHPSPIAESMQLLIAAATGGFLGQAARFLVASCFSNYRRLRSSAGLLCFPLPVLQGLIDGLHEPARIVREPLTISRKRVHLEIEFPGDTEERT